MRSLGWIVAILSAGSLYAGDLRLIDAVKDQDRKAIATLIREFTTFPVLFGRRPLPATGLVGQ